MWKIKNFFHHSKKSHLAGLMIVFLFVVIAAISFWAGMWAQTDRSLSQDNPKNTSQQQLINDKIKTTFSQYACDSKQETLVRGYIEKIDNDLIIVNDGAKQTKIILRPETVFVRVSVYPNGQSELAELPRSELKPGQDVVLSAFVSEDGLLYTLLVKQIVLKNI